MTKRFLQQSGVGMTHISMRKHLLPALLLLTATATAQQPPQKNDPFAGVDIKKVDEAIKKGVDYLKTQEAVFSSDPFGAHAPELVLLTYTHAGLRPGNPAYDALLKAMLDEPMKN